MLTELMSKHLKFTSGLVRKVNPTVDWKQTPLQASHGEVSPYPVHIGHPPDMDISQTLAEYRKVKTEDAPSSMIPTGDKRDVFLHRGEDATPVKIVSHPLGGHIIAGGAGNRLNGLRLYGVRPDVPAVDPEMSPYRLNDYQPQGIQANDYPVSPTTEDWSDYVNNLTHQDSDKRVNAEAGMATRNRTNGLKSLVSSRVPHEDGLVVVSPMARLREAHKVLSAERGNVGFYDEDGHPHGDVSRTVVTPDPNFAPMDVPRHVVYYDSAPNELHKTHNVASAHRITSSLDEPMDKAIVSGHWREVNGEPVWVRGYENSRRQAVPDVSPPQMSGMSVHQFDGGAALASQQAPQQAAVQPEPQDQSQQNPLEAYAQLGTKSPYFQNWFGQSAVRHPDTGEAATVYPVGTLNDTGSGLEELGNVRNALGTDLHFTSKPSSVPPKDIDPASVPIQYRHPMIDHLAALNVSQGQGGVDPRLQRAFLVTGNVAHLGVQNPDDQSDLANSLQRIIGSNQAAYASIQNPLKLTQSLRPEDAQAMLGSDPPLFHAVQSYKQSQGYRGTDWGKTLNAGDIVAGAASIGRQSQVGSIFGRAGYDGIYHRSGGEDHWIPFSPSQVKAQANIGTFDPKEEDIYKALDSETGNMAPHPTQEALDWHKGVATGEEPVNDEFGMSYTNSPNEYRKLYTGKGVQDYKERFAKNLKYKYPAIRAKEADIPNILNEDAYKSGYARHDDAGDYDKSFGNGERQEVERRFFGIPHGGDHQKRPIYGYMADTAVHPSTAHGREGHPSSYGLPVSHDSHDSLSNWYGNAEMMLKPNRIYPHATMSWGDSVWSPHVPSPVLDPHPASGVHPENAISGEDNGEYHSASSPVVEFPELQIHRPMTPSQDLLGIHFHGHYPPPQGVQDAMNSRGVKWSHGVISHRDGYFRHPHVALMAKYHDPEYRAKLEAHDALSAEITAIRDGKLKGLGGIPRLDSPEEQARYNELQDRRAQARKALDSHVVEINKGVRHPEWARAFEEHGIHPALLGEDISKAIDFDALQNRAPQPNPELMAWHKRIDTDTPISEDDSDGYFTHTPEQYHELYEDPSAVANYKDLWRDNLKYKYPSIREKRDDFPAILKSGMYKSGYAAHDDAGDFDAKEGTGVRSKVERRMFGIPIGREHQRRPVYGYMSDAPVLPRYLKYGAEQKEEWRHRLSHWYGGVEMMLHPEKTFPDATMSWGDSCWSPHAPTPVLDPHPVSGVHPTLPIKNGQNEEYKSNTPSVVQFPELQFHRPISVAGDVFGVHFHPEMTPYGKSMTPPSRETTDELDRQGIKWSYGDIGYQPGQFAHPMLALMAKYHDPAYQDKMRNYENAKAAHIAKQMEVLSGKPAYMGDAATEERKAKIALDDHIHGINERKINPEWHQAFQEHGIHPDLFKPVSAPQGIAGHQGDGRNIREHLGEMGI